MAAFLLGQGSYTLCAAYIIDCLLRSDVFGDSGNGSIYTDTFFQSELTSFGEKAKRSLAYNVRSYMGTKLVEHGYSFMRRWINANLVDPDQVLAFTPQSGIRVGDLKALGYTLLQNEAFDAVQVRALLWSLEGV